MLRPVLTFFDRFTTQSRNPTRLIDLRNVCGIFLACGILFGGELLAAPPNPPVFIGDDVIIAENNANRINAILDGYTVPAILSGLQYPADPVTTTTHEVRNNSQLASAVGGNGRLIRIYGPGNGGQSTYNQFDLGGRSDIDIVMDNDTTISGSAGWAWWGAVRRFRWTGGNINVAGSADGWRISDAEDVLFDDVRMYKSSGASGHVLYLGSTNHRRFAMINSTVEILPNVAPSYYAVIIGHQNNPVTASDWFFLNNRFIGNGPPVRKTSLGVRSVHVGNYYSSLTEQNQNASIRFHRSIDKMWFAHNVSVFGAGNQPNFNPVVGDPGHIMNDVRIEENRFFATRANINAGSVYRAGDMDPTLQQFATNWVFSNNIWSDPTGPAGGETFGGVFISVPYVREGDLRVGPGHPSYETAPSASGFGAAR